jgi:phosphomannomutase
VGIFKAYDIRGVYPDELNEDLSRRIGNAFAVHIGKGPLVVGRDMRVSSPEAAAAAIEGITDAGIDVIDIGLCTTPMSYFAIGSLEAAGGLMTTASHNPAKYNGFKVSREMAIPLAYETGLDKLELMVTTGAYTKGGARGGVEKRDVSQAYIDHVLELAGDIKPLTLAVDAGNGITGTFLPRVFDRLPCEVTPMYFEPDGTFPNHEANPLKAENVADLQAKVREIGANLGIAMDGDGDRCAFVDEKGQTVGSDLVTALVAQEVLKKYPGSGILYDLRSSRAVPEEIKAHGGRPVRSRVGHAYMKKIMRQQDIPFGGELSGHYYFRDNYYADSGFMAMVEVLTLLSASGKPFSEMVAPLHRYYATGEVNFTVKDKAGRIEAIAERFSDGRIDYLDGITVSYKDWWFNVRQSNTEPLLRLVLEANTPQLRDEMAAKVKAILARS